MKFKSTLACSVILGLSIANFAVAAPQTGTWLIGNGQHAYGGDIINIDAQDNSLFMIFAVGEVPNNTYFLYGRGAINGDNVEVELTSSKDLSKRIVTGSFNTSTTGVLSFPGVGDRSVFRVKLADETSAVSVLGLWSFSSISYSTGKGDAQMRYLSSVSPTSSTGDGIAMDDTMKFGCEYQQKGDFQGLLICADVTNSSAPRVYGFKRSANEASGVHSQSGTVNSLALASRLQTSDGKTPLIIKSGSEQVKAVAIAIQNFVNNPGAEAKKMLIKKN